MQTLFLVLASSSGLVAGFGAAFLFSSRNNALLTAKLKSAKKEVEDLEDHVEALKVAKLAMRKAEKALEEGEEKWEEERKELGDKLAAAEKKLKTAAPTKPTEDLKSALDKAKKDLGEILGALVKEEKQRAAVLCEASGIVVAQAGDSETVDAAAASAQVLTSIPTNLKGLLPLSNSFFFDLSDKDMSIVGQCFDQENETVALTVIGDKAADERSVAATVKQLQEALR